MKIGFEAGRPSQKLAFIVDSKFFRPVFDTGTNVKEIENVGKFEVDITVILPYTGCTFVGKRQKLKSVADVNGALVEGKIFIKQQ